MARPEWVDDLVASLSGSNSDDAMGGSTGNDTIDAAAGDDTVAGEEGNDIIDGGDGNDVLYGDMAEGFDQGVDATPLILDINNRESVSHDGGNGSVGDYAVFRDVATLADGSKVWGKLVLVDKSNPNMSVKFDTFRGAEILLNGDSSGDQASFRLEFFDPATGNPVYLNSTATFNDIDDNRSGGHHHSHSDPEAVIIDGNSFTSYGVSADSSLTTNVDGNTVTATGSEQNNYQDQDAWFSAQFEDRSSIEFTLQTRDGGAGFTLSGNVIDDAIVTPIEQGNDTILAGDGNDFVYGQDGNDALYGDAGNDHLDGGEGDDLMEGGVGNDTLIGGEGGDTIAGGEGDDYIEGGAGDDYLTTGLGNDTLIGGEGDDTLKNSAGDDSLVGGVGNDSIVATDGNDTLEGGEGNDTMYGGNDNDLLVGGAGDDLMFGEADMDVFRMSDGFGNDTLSGGEAGVDYDSIDLTNVTSGLTVTYTGDEAGRITDGSDTITFSEIEGLDLTDQADFVDGSADSAGLSIDAGGGDDTIKMGSGGDLVTGGAGYDQIVLTTSGGMDTIADFDIGDDDANSFFNDQLDVSELTGGTGPFGAIRTSDVTVSDDGIGNALLTFPGGEKLVLSGVAPTEIDTHAKLFAAGIPCFTPDVMIATKRGAVPAGEIKVGDLLQTADNGYQPVIWVGTRALSAAELALRPHLRPYCLAPNGLLSPERPMWVSPQHRFMVHSRTFERDLPFGESFLSAKLLSQIDDKCRQRTSVPHGVTYVHLMTEQHEVVFAEGIATETFWPGPEAIRGLSSDNMRELFELFPELSLARYLTGDEGRGQVRQTYGELARLSLGRSDLKTIRAA